MADHYYVVIDYECTCSEDRDAFPNEIIEFPAVVMNSRTLEVEYEFQRYVHPTENPLLTDFCTDLTGITQADVDGADELECVMDEFHQFLGTNNITNYTMCTDGPWDFQKFLYPESKRKGLPLPRWAKHWIDIRRKFQNSFDLAKWIGVSEMLEMLGLEFEGRPHSGIDDARNIARIVARVHKREAYSGPMKCNRNICYNPRKGGF